ncbi:unnamed protein product [Phytomonas sp. EM1]|nr:unnamed protein product [Phytomonas sp. EM1]|eukprot:CCW63861.1 unnamed protein product [Phytomonas sp. isolate EM1]
MNPNAPRGAPNEVRALHLAINVMAHCHSSATVEIGHTRVIAIVRPPKQLTQEYRGTRGRVSCQVHAAPRGLEAATSGLLSSPNESGPACKDLALALEGVAEQAVMLESVPQLLIEVVMEIARDEGGVWDAATTAMSVALAVGGFEMRSLFTACSAGLLEDGSLMTDLDAAEEQRALALTKVCVALGTGDIYLMQHRGCCEVSTLAQLSQSAIDGAFARKAAIVQQVKEMCGYTTH